MAMPSPAAHTVALGTAASGLVQLNFATGTKGLGRRLGTGIPRGEYCADRTDYLCRKDGVESNDPVSRGLSRPGHLPEEAKERHPAAA